MPASSGRLRIEEEIVAPSVDLLESMRSVGYSLESAVADLIDNSLTAHAHLIEIDADVVEGKYIAILDDGDGMAPDVAREALRLAGSVGKRDEADLGRFGLGLKTASLSQARSLTVVSRRGGRTTGLRWDIDHIRASRSWSLLVLDQESIAALPMWDRLERLTHGTLVVWSDLDLLLGDSKDKGAFVGEQLATLRESLSLVFHRFLRGGRDPFGISVNGIKLKPTDPFLSSNPRTQITLTEVIPIGGSEVSVTAYTLPHPSGLSADESRRSDLGERMREAQGFYVYRNRRLISRGHWYGLAQLSELTKQTRVQVDVPNTLDNLWQLDIKKSRAQPPLSFKAHLRRIIDPMLARGRRVHTFRGRKEAGAEVTHVWSKIKDRSGFRYEVNLDNPAVQAMLSPLSTSDGERVLKLLQTVADTYPLLDAYQEMAGSNIPATRGQDEHLVRDQLRGIRDSGHLGANIDFVQSALRSVEPFNAIANLERLVAEVWKEKHAD